MASNYTRRINLYINGKEVVTEIRSVTAEMQKLVNKQKNMTIGSKEYVAAGERIRLLKGIIADHNNQLKATATGWERIVQVSNKLQGIMQAFVLGAAAFTGLLLAGKKAVSMFAEFDDQVANVARVTGLTKEEIYAMNESLKKVNTRTAQIELMGLGVIAGKLGIAKNDIEGFIRAADKINVALAGALGTDTEEAINQIGKLVDIFKLKDKFGIEESMLKVGSALVTLGNASTANEGYIVEFTKRVGGIAPIVGVSIQNVMGLAATLDQLGQTSEVSSTVYSGMITGMFKKTAEYANIAGMSITHFKNLLNKDTNQAFIKVLEGLNGNNAGMDRMVSLLGDMGLEGKRSVQVLGVLSNNTKLLRDQQSLSNDALFKGTQIYDAFNIKNESAQAVLEKARKNITNLSIELGQKLLPVLKVSTSGFSYFVKTVSISIDFFLRHSKAITIITATLITYGLTVKAISVWESLRHAIITKGIILSNLEVIGIRLRILLTNESTFAQKRAIVTNKALNATMASSIWGAVAAGIVMASMAIYEWIKNASKASAAQEAVNNAMDRSVEKMVEQTSKIDLLLRLINSENVSLATKKKAIEELKSILPGYTAMLNDQGKVIFQNTEAVKGYVSQLRKQYLLEAFKEEFSKASVEYAKAQESHDKLVGDYAAMKGPDTQPGMTYETSENTAKGDLKDKIAESAKALKEKQSVVDALQNKIEASLNTANDLTPKINFETAEVLKYNAALKITNLTLEQKELLEEGLSKHIELRNKYINESKGIGTAGIITPDLPVTNPSDPTSPVGSLESRDNKAAKAAEDAAKAAEEAYKQQQEIQRKAVESSISIMEEGYQKELFTLHAAYATQREAIVHELEINKKLTSEEKANLNTALSNTDKKYVADYNKLTDEQKLKTLKFNKEMIDLQLESVKSGSEEEFKLKKDQLEASRFLEIASITETGEQKEQKIKYLNDKFEKLQKDEDSRYSSKVADDKLAGEMMALNEAETQKLEALKLKRAAGEISQKEYNKQLLALQKQFTQDSLQIAINHAQGELDILIASGIASVEETTQAQEALTALKLKKQDEDTGKEANSDKDTWTTNDTLNASVDSAKMIADAEFQISRDKHQRELDDKLSQLAKQRDAELSNKRLTESQKDAINLKFDAKERKLKAAAWKKQHRADLAQAWVNLALSVGKAAINVWPLPAIPMMAMAALEGGLQVAAVASQKMPEFYEGGYTQSAGSNRKPAGIVHSNEYVIPAEGVNNPQLRPFLDTIEMARLNGNLPRLNPAIFNNGFAGFQEGGFSSIPARKVQSSKVDNPVENLQLSPEVLQVMKGFTDAMNNIQKNGVRGNWSLFDLEKIQKGKSSIQSSTEM